MNYNEIFKMCIISVGNYCQGDLCQNNGICIPEEHGYYCYCLAGFSGDKCQTGIDANLPSLELIISKTIHIVSNICI